MKRRETWGKNPVSSGGHGPLKRERPSLAAASVITPDTHPPTALFLSSLHFSVMTRVSIPLLSSYRNANTIPRTSKNKLARLTVCVCVFVCVCVWESSTWRRFGFVGERDQCCVRCVWGGGPANEKILWGVPENGAFVPLTRLRVAFCTEWIVEADVSVLRVGWMSELSVFLFFFLLYVYSNSTFKNWNINTSSLKPARWFILGKSASFCAEIKGRITVIM